jgi:hypothetical protein
MPDLDQLLHGYADQIPTGPQTPFAAVVRRRRRRRLGIVSACAAGILVLVGAVAVATSVGGSRHAVPADGREDGPSPATLDINGVTVHREVSTPIVDVQAQSSTDTGLIVQAGSTNPTTPTPCESWTDARVVSQSDTTIELAAAVYRDSTPQPPNYGCAGVGHPPAVFHLDLGRPLGTRSIVQDGTVLAPLLLDSLFLPAVVPDGYATDGATDQDFFGKREGRHTTTYTGPDQNTYLFVQQGPVATVATERQSMTILSRTTVRGHDAFFWQTSGFDDNRCLAWAESDDLGLAVCSFGTHAPLGLHDLTPVAESLSRG